MLFILRLHKQPCLRRGLHSLAFIQDVFRELRGTNPNGSCIRRSSVVKQDSQNLIFLSSNRLAVTASLTLPKRLPYRFLVLEGYHMS